MESLLNKHIQNFGKKKLLLKKIFIKEKFGDIYAENVDTSAFLENGFCVSSLKPYTLEKKSRYSYIFLRKIFKKKKINKIKNRNKTKKKNKKKIKGKKKSKRKSNNKRKIKKKYLKRLLKQHFFKYCSNYKINYYIKKLVISFLSFYNLQLRRIRFFLKTQKIPSVFLKNIRASLIPNKDIFLLKTILFLINTRKHFKTKYEFLIQRKFLAFLIKHNKQIVNLRERFYIKQLFFNFFKLSKTTKFKRKTFLQNKKAILFCVFKKKGGHVLGKKKSKLYAKLVGLITKQGNKTKALNIVNKSLFLTSLKLKMPINLILHRIFNKLKTSVEIKKIRVRRGYHFVPFPVNFRRKVYLMAKWILLSTKKNKQKSLSFSNKLQSEYIKIIKTKKAASGRNKKYNIFKSLQNRANSHFRW
jgi:ribosomal protein S7